MSRPSAKAEYRFMASTAAGLTWLSFLLYDLGIALPRPPILHCDNLSALYMTVNPVFHGRTKHIELDYHYVREKVALGSLETHFVPSNHELADIFTKPLSKVAFRELRNKLGLCLDPQPSLRGSKSAAENQEAENQEESISRPKPPNL